MRPLVLISIIAVWIFALVNESGYGMLLSTSEKMNWLILIWASYLYIIRQRKFIPNVSLMFVLSFFLFFVLIAFLISGTWHGASYIVSFLTVFCFSCINISPKELALSSLSIGALGLGLIYIYTRTDILSGWNDNSIAMLTLFSYIYFSIFFNSAKSRWVRLLCLGMTVFYMMQISGTDSRGALLFMLLATSMMLTRETMRRLIEGSKIRNLIVYFPLIVAIVTVWCSSQDWMVDLNNWSEHNFGKLFFNGRDTLWFNAFEDVLKYPFGRGEFIINYHNSSVGCIGAFGIIGFLLWTNFFKRQLTVLAQYIDDYTVYACMCGFIIIYMQQSTELGFINQTPNMLPYMILGLGLGRVRWYEKKE